MKQAINRRRKILYVITKATYGGAQKYVYDLTTNLPKVEFEPIVAYGTHGKLADDLSKAGIEIRQLPSLGRDIAVISDIRSFFEILKTLRAVKPDVIHLNSSKAAALGALAARIAGVPKIIFTVHGWPFKENRNIVAKLVIWKLSWLTALFVHKVIVISRTDEELGHRMPLISKKISYIPVGIKTQELLSHDAAIEKLSVTAPSPRIVTIAELTANKGIRYAIEAIAILRNKGIEASYFIIGDGEKRQALERLVRSEHISDNVHFLGFVDNAVQYLKAFDIFLLPSVKEGMPYVLLEAAAAGLPIVATEVVKAEATRLPNIRFVPPGDGHALADEIERLALNMPAKTSSTVGSFTTMLDKTIELYR